MDKYKITENEASDIDVLDENGEMILSTLNFRRPYLFEGKEYKEVDLSGLESLKTSDMIAVSKLIDRNGSFSFMQELSLEFACHIAARAANLPVEFFKGLPMKEGARLKNRITGFLYGAD